MRTFVLTLACVVACGGPDKPAQDDTALLASSTHTSATSEPPPPQATSEGVARGTKLLEAGDLAGARRAFEEAIAKNAHDAEAHHYLGVTLEKQNDKVGAENEYKAALAIRHDLVETAANLGAMYVDAQRWDDAIAVLRPVLVLRPDSAAADLNLALAYAGKGDQASAVHAFDAAVKLTPTDAMLLYTYGHTLATFNQNDAAIAKLKAAANAAGSQADVLGSIGQDLLVLRAVPECIATFDKAIAAEDAAQFRTARALCKLASKDEAGALADLESATKNEPNYPLAHYWLATRRMAAKKWADAAKELEAYLRIEPNGPKAKSAHEALAVAKNGGKKK